MTTFQRDSRGYIVLTDQPTRGQRIFTALPKALFAACAIGILFFCLWLVWATAEGRGADRLIREEYRQEIDWRLRNHKPEPLPLNTTVEITEWGYRYEWKGKWIPLAWAGPRKKTGGLRP